MNHKRSHDSSQAEWILCWPDFFHTWARYHIKKDSLQNEQRKTMRLGSRKDFLTALFALELICEEKL